MGVRWRCDLDKPVLTQNFLRRGWIDVSAEATDDRGDWDLYWASVGSVKDLFSSECSVRLQPHQRINHFPNHYELTRKDLMVKNVKRYQRQVKRDGGNPDEYDIIPTTFVLPQDYMLFAEEFRRSSQQQQQQQQGSGGGGSGGGSDGCGSGAQQQPSGVAAAQQQQQGGSGGGGGGGGGGVAGPGGGGSTWIMKPSGKSQGKGIFLINKLSQIKQWSVSSLPPALRNGNESYVVSRYIDNPLLVGGKKFDMRIYVLVTSFKPLKVYMSRLGFGRFCNVKYSAEVGELSNEFMHLTNVAIQQHGEDYNSLHGNKWPLDLLRTHLEAVRGQEAADRMFADIEDVILKSLRACQNIIINDRHCFELYGYDIIVDDTLKPWLIEVNASPSLSTTTQSDRLLKMRVISDALNVVSPLDWLAATDPAALPPDMWELDPATYPFRERVGSMVLICDESDDFERFKAAQRARAAKAAAAAAAAAAGGVGGGGGAAHAHGGGGGSGATVAGVGGGGGGRGAQVVGSQRAGVAAGLGLRPASARPGFGAEATGQRIYRNMQQQQGVVGGGGRGLGEGARGSARPRSAYG